MKFPNFNMNKSFAARALVLLAGLLLMTAAGFAQNPTLEQCRNESAASPAQCATSAWVTGSVNATHSHYAETQYLPTRMRLNGTTVGATYSVTIGYDIIKSKHAIDYLGTFNNTETNADPCGDVVSGCSPSTPTDIIGIPNDQGSGALTGPLGVVNQPPGVFSIWGGTFDHTVANAPAYNTYSSGDTHRAITITFKATGTDLVIAWGAHIAWSGDWGAGNSAGGISGASYHQSLDVCVGFSCGHQDIQLMTAGVLPSAIVTIIKVVNTEDGTGVSPIAFPFQASSNFGAALNTFSMIDNVSGDAGASRDSAPITDFSAGPASVTVSEQTPSIGSLQNLSCVDNFASSTTVTFPTPVNSGLAGTIVASVGPGGHAVCTFTNTLLGVTAAPATVSGRVTNAAGRGIGGVTVTLSDLSSGQVRTALTNSFGFYTFVNCKTEDFYMLSVASKTYKFQTSRQTFTLQGDLLDLNFKTIQ